MSGLDDLRLAVRSALEKRGPEVAHRTHWRDESTAKLKRDLAEWGLDPSSPEVAAAFLAGAHYMRLIAIAAIDSGHSVPKRRVHDWLTEGLLVAGERLEAVEWLQAYSEASEG